MSAPTVSVVMPVFNGERFVGEAIQSILGQTYRDFEFVIVDDGSTDRTPEILAAAAKADERIVIHRQPRNMGFRTALNTGCERAQGQFIARMDADDVSHPERLEKQTSYLFANPLVGVVGSRVQLLNDRGERGRVHSYPLEPGLVAWSLFFFSSLAHPAVTMRRRVLEEAGFYPAGCSGGTEDYALFVRLSHVTKLANLPDVLLLYRTWGGNMSKQAWDAQERSATEIVASAMSDVPGMNSDVAMASALRGLATDRYPQTSDELRRVGETIVLLHRGFLQHPLFDDKDRASVSRDAAVRLWLLAALALRRSPALAISLSAKATRLRPSAFFTFSRKLTRRLFSRDR